MERYIGAEALSNDINVLEPFELNDDEKCIVFKTIRQQPTADVVERTRLKQLIERKYGDLDNDRGCNVNGQWLSVAAIVELIDQAATE